MKTFIYLVIILIFNYCMMGQVGIGTDSPSQASLLDIDGNGGVALPRIALQTETHLLDPISSDTNGPFTPIDGMIIYNTNAAFVGSSGSGCGMYLWMDRKWNALHFGPPASSTGAVPWLITTTTNLPTAYTDNMYHEGDITLGSDTSHNISEPGALVNLQADDKGLLLNRVDLVSLVQTDPLITPNAPAQLSEGMLVYHTGSNGINEGVYYWSDSRWNVVFSASTIKPMNQINNDNDTYVHPTNPYIIPKASQPMNLFECEYDAIEQGIAIGLTNNPIAGFDFFQDILPDANNLQETIFFPQQALGNCINITISFKYDSNIGNSSSARVIAKGSLDGITYETKIKESFLKFLPISNVLNTARAELNLANIVVTQNMIDHGIRIFIGSADNGQFDLFEPILTLNYGTITI